MKVRYKINTLRGIFFCLKMNTGRLFPRTVFSQTQKIKNVCLKRRFQFVGRKKLQIENPFPFARKEFASFSAPFSLSSALVLLRRNKAVLRSTSLQKGKHFPFAPMELKSSSLCTPRLAGGTLHPVLLKNQIKK